MKIFEKEPIRILEVIPTDYIYPVFEGMEIVRENIRAIASVVKGLYRNPDRRLYLVCRGTSGIILATELKLALPEYKNLSIRFVRKDGENAHTDSSPIYEGVPIIVIDDFIATGATMEEIAKSIRRSAGTLMDVETVIAKKASPSSTYKDGRTYLPQVFPDIKYLIR